MNNKEKNKKIMIIFMLLDNYQLLNMEEFKIFEIEKKRSKKNDNMEMIINLLT